jgi:hypothetical protein
MTRSKSRLLNLTLAAAAIAGFAASAWAQDVDALRKKYTLNVPDIANNPATQGEFFRGAPGTNSGSPSAFGPNWGDAFVGGGYQNQTRGIKQRDGSFSTNGGDDGSISAGFGVGNSTDAVGLEVVVTSLSTFHSGFGNRTAFSFQVNRMVGNTSAIAVGVENGFIAGGGKTDGTDSWYAVGSTVFSLTPVSDMKLVQAITLSGGVGNGRFRLIDDAMNNKSTVNVFATASVLIHEQVSAIVDYTGQDINVGVSVVPFRWFPLVVTPTFADVAGMAARSPRFILGVGIGMHF